MELFFPNYQNQKNPKYTWVVFLLLILILLITYQFSACGIQKEITRTHKFAPYQFKEYIELTIDNSRRFYFRYDANYKYSYEDLFIKSKLNFDSTEMIISATDIHGKRKFNEKFKK